MEQVSLEVADLATVAGASAAAIVLTQFAKRLFGLAAKGARTTALVVALILVVGVTIWTSNPVDPATIILAAIVGAQAGLAASAAFDAATEGFAHQTFPKGTQESAVRGLAITGEDELNDLSPARGE